MIIFGIVAALIVAVIINGICDREYINSQEKLLPNWKDLYK